MPENKALSIDPTSPAAQAMLTASGVAGKFVDFNGGRALLALIPIAEHAKRSGQQGGTPGANMVLAAPKPAPGIVDPESGMPIRFQCNILRPAVGPELQIPAGMRATPEMIADIERQNGGGGAKGAKGAKPASPTM